MLPRSLGMTRPSATVLLESMYCGYTMILCVALVQRGMEKAIGPSGGMRLLTLSKVAPPVPEEEAISLAAL